MRNSFIVGLALVVAGVLFLVLSSFSFAGVAFAVIGGLIALWSTSAMLRHWRNNRGGDGGESASWATAALARRRQAARRERRHRTA